jgi:DNA-binding NarL/FixJ family response regulator
MSAGTTGTVVVVARDSMQGARVEAALRGLGGWRIVICRPSSLLRCCDEHPDAIVVMALAEPEMRRTLRAMRSWPRPPAVVTLSAGPAELWTAAARSLGLRATLPLNAGPDALTAAVRAVHGGLYVLHPEALPRSTARDAMAGRRAPLTPREREILELMADGANNRVIASRLGISRHTVKFHVASILAKLGTRSRTEAVAAALRGGLLTV